jgi:hypothetical protein
MSSSREHVVRDMNGHAVGKLIESGNDSCTYAKDYWTGRTLGRYEPYSDRTRDDKGHTVGTGNLLMSFFNI